MFEPLFAWMGPVGATALLVAILSCVLWVVAAETLAVARPITDAHASLLRHRLLRAGGELRHVARQHTRGLRRLRVPLLPHCRWRQRH